MTDIFAACLPAAFYRGSTEQVAKKILGKVLVHRSEYGLAAGRIVEVEAYLFRGDPACHAARGKTPRNAAMFGLPGTAYVYLIYGIHYCFNVVTGIEGEGEAVLVRALEPLAGLELMSQRRGTGDIKQLCSGPGKLCRALAIGATENGACLYNGNLYLADDGYSPGEVVVTTRIGITAGAELPLRYYLRQNPYISRK